MRALALAIVLVSAPAHAAPGWDLRIPERVDLVAGASGSLPIAITLDRGLTISKDAALTLDLAPEGALTIKRRRLGRGDAVDPDADAPRFAVPLRADVAGDYTLKIRLRCWVCGTWVCRPVDAKRTVSVAVAAQH
jgi:hypothetical protein